MDKEKQKKRVMTMALGLLTLGAVGFVALQFVDYHRRLADHDRIKEMLRKSFLENKELSTELAKIDVRYSDLLKEIESKGKLDKEGQEKVSTQISTLKKLTQEQQALQKNAEFLQWIKEQFAEEQAGGGEKTKKKSEAPEETAAQLEKIQKIILEKQKASKEWVTKLEAAEDQIRERDGEIKQLQMDLSEQKKNNAGLNEKLKKIETELKSAKSQPVKVEKVSEVKVPSPKPEAKSDEKKTVSTPSDKPQKSAVVSHDAKPEAAPKKAEPVVHDSNKPTPKGTHSEKLPPKGGEPSKSVNRGTVPGSEFPQKKEEAGMDVQNENALLKQRLMDAEKQNQLFVQQLEKLNYESQNQKESVLYNLGVIYFSTSLYVEAGKMFEKALKIDPNDASAHYNLAILYDDHLDKKDKAMEHYERFLSLSKDEEKKRQVLDWMQVAKQNSKPHTQTNVQSASEAFKKILLTTAG